MVLQCWLKASGLSVVEGVLGTRQGNSGWWFWTYTQCSFLCFLTLETWELGFSNSLFFSTDFTCNVKHVSTQSELYLLLLLLEEGKKSDPSEDFLL